MTIQLNLWILGETLPKVIAFSFKLFEHKKFAEGYARFNALKNTNPKLKTQLAIGGWNEGSKRFSNMVLTKTSRKIFIESALKYLKTYGFDGIDLDWEYPTRREGRPEDKNNVSLLLKEMREEFDKHGYILTMAVVSGVFNVESMYEVSSLSRYLDYILVMAYDMHSSTDNRTGENSPLRSNDTVNVEYGVKSWISKGAKPSKIVLGIGAYGKSFTLADRNDHGIGAASIGPGQPGPYSKAKGTLYHYEVLELIRRSGWTREWSNEQVVPFAYDNDQWVGYDDVESVATKVDFAKNQGLGGLMLWSVDMDDPRGIAGEKFPLTRAIISQLEP
ncbi:hypothetical protein FQR65_LT11042 [Abscondita terminalis]|nr:hypothetical protein FQR65_LT11042 [Abscondita terminalis]